MTIDTEIEILTDRRTCMECVRGNGSCEDCDHAFDMAINSLAERKTMTHEEAVGFLQESGWLQDHDKQIYEQGKRDGIEWHPYPKEKPKENESYLVTFEGYITGNSYVNISSYFWDGFVHRRVTAWAELPKPYEEGSDNGQHQL